jgi:hypothetical protein
MDKPFELRAQAVRMEEPSFRVHPLPLMIYLYVVDRNPEAEEFAECCVSVFE